jgi:hypothetical protein
VTCHHVAPSLGGVDADDLGGLHVDEFIPEYEIRSPQRNQAVKAPKDPNVMGKDRGKSILKEQVD